MTWRDVISTLTQVLAIAAFTSALALGAARLNFPNAKFWEGKTPWLLVALVITSLPSAVQTFFLERGERRRRKALEQEEKLRLILTASLVDLARNCGLDWESIGVRAFVTRKKKLRRIYQHKRIGFVKLNSGPASGIKWINGKGIVGQCWATSGKRQFENFGRFAGHNNGTWMVLSPADRYELTFEELRLMRERYGVVAAVPMISGTDYLGCITMDTEPAPANVPDRMEVWRSLGVTAALVKSELDL
jgi:hypothetical protein